MGTGFDERCAADLSNVVDGRGLRGEDAAWLARVVTGAIRPNRDKPLWDLAHFFAALAAIPGRSQGRDLVDLVLDPSLARPAILQRRMAELGAPGDERGLVLRVEATDWRIGWSGAARLLALAEFVLTAEDLSAFPEVCGWLDDLTAHPLSAAAVTLLVRKLVKFANTYRQAHLPLAPVEKQFRAILTFLGERKRARGFDEDDILDFWRAELEGGERTGFRTVAEHFLVFERLGATLGGLSGLAGAASLESVEGWEDRLDAALGDIVGEDPAIPLLQGLEAFEAGPKILTGAEREHLTDALRLEPFHRSRPLTVLRAISFGRVQSGIANRLRRGTGGPDVAERARCDDAEPYAAIGTRMKDLQGHLDRMVHIAAALRLAAKDVADPQAKAKLQAAEADLRRVRRAGFEDREALAEAFEAVDEILLRAAGELSAFMQSIEAFSGRQPIAARFEADRTVFAAALGRAYAEERV